MNGTYAHKCICSSHDIMDSSEFFQIFTACEELLPLLKKKGEEGHLCRAVINCVLVSLEC